MNKQLLEESLVLVDLPDSGLTVRFYEILFDRYPAVQPMFQRDTRVQAEMLRTAVVSVLDHLDDAEWLTTNLHALGRRHADLGVTRPMYTAVAECMIAAMSEIGGDSWTPAMTDAWGEALGAIATIMLDGYPDEVASDELAADVVPTDDRATDVVNTEDRETGAA
ncbi:flavoprotein [Gordonia sp. zg691]|uniref:globin domain-containing protein n=1 Tax=Gordonia jinghuaiqii TaxID=2758710 RepID=UPI0016625C7F|nr:globin domain-containing protein [Gordonia jinghuaiqii]MBD0862429.1 flavoprotein [Gordonia jinghuaiqii]